jgi:hypothetical protein
MGKAESMEQRIRIPHNWSIPPSISRHVAEVPGAQRALEGDGHLLLILHRLPSGNSVARELAMFWRSDAGEWNSMGHGAGIASLRRHVAEYGERLSILEKAENSATCANDYFQIRREVTPIYRAARNMATALSRAYEMAPGDRELLACRNLALTVERSSELLKDDTTYGIEFHMAKQAEMQALASHRLNLIASVFFPILAFSSIFGMNLDNGFEHQGAPWLFWIFVLAGIGIGLAMKTVIFNSSKTPKTS